MSVEVSLHFVFSRCIIVGETQVRAEGKDKLAIVKEDLKRGFFFYLDSWVLCPSVCLCMDDVIWNKLCLN